MKDILLSNRMKSLYWRTAMMGLAIVLGGVAQAISESHIAGEWVVMTGLILGEISKALNTKVTATDSVVG